MASPIQHVFVLMLENRSFDHMLGFSSITGKDAVTGAPTTINGLRGDEPNTYNGQTYTVSQGADDVMPCDPNHEFDHIVQQLCGSGVTYPAGGAYPAIKNSGFVASYVASGGGTNPGEIMKCFRPDQLPVLNALAREFVVCDNWHASLPGPTWPNRMFVHAASSGGLDHSPSNAEIIEWETIGGFSFKNGTIFDALQKKGIRRRLYAGDDFPMVSAIKGIKLDDIRHFGFFAGDLENSTYDYQYIFIEPSYNVLQQYKNSTSQHPLTDVTLGEGLIKQVYEVIRRSAFWEMSMLIITWDEHGGFYDHEPSPPPATPPGDTAPDAKNNRFGFTFAQYGPRVPALVISPLIPKNVVDHRLYDHASICATVESIFGLPPLTERDKAANRLDTLVTLAAPRDDTPLTLPMPAPLTNPTDSVDNVINLPGVIQVAMRQQLEIVPDQLNAILARVGKIQTRADAQQYLEEVRRQIAVAKSSASM